MADLFSEFNAVSAQEWQKSVEKVLKGQSIDTLNWQYDESLELAPLYTKSATQDTAFALQHKKDNAWDVIIAVAEADYSTLEEMNADILSHLAGGATELIISLNTVSKVDQILKGVWLDMVRISWQVSTIDLAKDLLANLTPLLGEKTIKGHLYIAQANAAELYDFGQIYLTNKQMQYSLFNIKISLDKISLAQDLANALNLSSEWINLYIKAGKTIAEAISNLQIEVSVNDAYFVAIAKIRAFKKLWLALLTYFKVETLLLPRLIARTTSLNFLDKNGDFSLLAATSQALSSVIAGIDGLCITPPNNWEGIDSKTAARLVRNVHYILLEESHLDAVMDPAAGAYYIEAATSELTQAAWDLCQL